MTPTRKHRSDGSKPLAKRQKIDTPTFVQSTTKKWITNLDGRSIAKTSHVYITHNPSLNTKNVYM